MAGDQYRKTLGQIEIISLGIGGTIGSGIFVVPGVAAGLLGPASLAAWAVVAVSAALVMLPVAWLSGKFGRRGTFFTMWSSVFGRNVSTVIVLLYTVSAIFGVATIAAGIGQYFSYLGVADMLAIEMLCIGVFCGINLIGMSVSGVTETFLTVLKIVPLVIITLVLLPFVRPGNLEPSVPITLGGFFSALIIVYWPFTGFEISAIPVDEVRDPRCISRSLGIVMLTVTGLYLALNLALVGTIGAAALAASPAPVAAAIGFLSPAAGMIVAGIGIFAMLSAMNAYIVGSSRVFHHLAREWKVPGIQHINRQGIPDLALLVCCIAPIILLFFSNRFSTFAVLAVVTTLVPYIFFSASAWFLFPTMVRRLVSGAGAIMTAGILILFFLYG